LFSGSTQCAVHKYTHLYIGILTIADPTMMVAINDGNPPSHWSISNLFSHPKTKTRPKMKANAKHQRSKLMETPWYFALHSFHHRISEWSSIV